MATLQLSTAATTAGASTSTWAWSVAGALLALVAAVITNVVLAEWERRRVRLIDRLEDARAQGAQASESLTNALTQRSFGRVLAAFVDFGGSTGAVEPGLVRAYHDMSLTHYQQAAATALAPFTDSATVSARCRLAADEAERQFALRPMVELTEQALADLVTWSRRTAEARRSAEHDLAAHDARTTTVSRIGATTLLISLVVVAGGDLLAR